MIIGNRGIIPVPPNQDKSSAKSAQDRTPISLSIVTTLYHSATYIQEFHQRITQVAQELTPFFEVIYVNDGSPDASAEVVQELRKQDPRVALVDLSKNFGHHKAILEGLRHSQGERVFLIDCDLEEPPELLSQFWKRLNEATNVDAIYGVNEKRKDRALYRWFGSLFWRVFNKLTGTKISLNPSTVRIMSRRYVEALGRYHEDSVFFMGVAAAVGFKQETLPIAKSSKGSSTYNFYKRLKLSADAIISFSSKPLLFIGFLGLFMSAGALGMFAYFFIRSMVYGVVVSGWASLITSIWFVGGCSIGSLGIMGLYIAKVFSQVKSRPQVVVRDFFPSLNQATLSKSQSDFQLSPAPAPRDPEKIPFNKPSLSGREVEHIVRAVINGHSAGDGPYTRNCEEIFRQAYQASRVLLTTSCTHALEMAGLLLDLKPGDEVIVPSFTFVTTASAFAIRGAKPVFVDVREDTLNLDESLVERHITPKTRAIIPVHYGGVGCDMDTLMAIANRHQIPVVEDNAHGPFARYKGKLLGTFGALSTLSFHETKNFICGEGGALIINDKKYVERAEILREKGTDRSRFLRGQVDKYTWCDLGSSYVMSDLLAAFLQGQLENREAIAKRRTSIWTRYAEELSPWAQNQGVRFPQPRAEHQHSHHVFYLIFPSLESRTDFIQYMADRKIQCVFHYAPLHLSPIGKSYGERNCPVAEKISDRLVRIPLFPSMTSGEQERVIESIKSFQVATKLRKVG